jgi:hypothetical protein
MTPRTAAKVDANQADIVAALRRIGATVQCLHQVGHGCPDLLVGWHGENILLEVKMPGGDMTPDELKLHDDWQGEVNIVRSISDALECLR